MRCGTQRKSWRGVYTWWSLGRACIDWVRDFGGWGKCRSLGRTCRDWVRDAAGRIGELRSIVGLCKWTLSALCCCWLRLVDVHGTIDGLGSICGLEWCSFRVFRFRGRRHCGVHRSIVGWEDRRVRGCVPGGHRGSLRMAVMLRRRLRSTSRLHWQSFGVAVPLDRHFQVHSECIMAIIAHAPVTVRCTDGDVEDL